MNHVFIVNYREPTEVFRTPNHKSEKWTLKDVEFHNTIKLFKSVIIDESHKVKSTATQQSKFCKGITAGKEWIILLTGTPVVNKPNDLICQLAIMDRMNDLGGWKYFTSRYCSGPHGASNLKELNFMLGSIVSSGGKNQGTDSITRQGTADRDLRDHQPQGIPRRRA